MKLQTILFLTILSLMIALINPCGSHHHHHHHDKHEHGLNHDHNHNHDNNGDSLGYFSMLSHKMINYLTHFLEKYSKKEQAYIGAGIISTAPLPIFLLIIIFNIRHISLLNIMSAFASGSLLGDVFIHNIPELYYDVNSSKTHYFNKEVWICLGCLSIFFIEKIVLVLFKKKDNHDDKHTDDAHGHNHHHQDYKSSNIFIAFIGDITHNFTDGLAIAAGFTKNIKIGVAITVGIFFHEIPHEVGDFSYLLKQDMSIMTALRAQLLAACGSFIGVYFSIYSLILDFLIGDAYTNEMLAFTSGSFLYIALNTILGDLKESKSIMSVISETLAFLAGIYVMIAII